jgi:hypothetical protein
MLRHIFGDKVAMFGGNKGRHMGEMYMQIIYLYPRQILPILALVSLMRGTGKSTFGDWLNAIFADNVANLNPNNISSNFSSSYATKNIIMIEETKFEKSQDLEKLKAISTQKTMTVNTKFVAEYQVAFFGKIILFSNHEDRFVMVDDEEIRYWVNKIPQITVENHNILNDLVKEIPKFLYWLTTLPKPDFSQSRQVFKPEELDNELLAQTKENSRSAAHRTALMYLDKHMLEHSDQEEISFTNLDFFEHFMSKSKWDPAYLSKVLKYELKLEKAEKVIRYRTLGNTIDTKDGRGRPYTVKNPYFNEVEEQDDLPF